MRFKMNIANWNLLGFVNIYFKNIIIGFDECAEFIVS